MLINNDTILKDTNPFVRQKSLPVSLPLSKEDEELLNDMFQYVKESCDPELAEKKNLRPAVGISAIQVGVPKKMTAVIVHDIDSSGNQVTYEFKLVNPRIVSSSVQKAYLANGEGCLSVEEDHPGIIQRSARITFEAYDLIRNDYIKVRARGYLAIVLQHEFDHFDGILYYDHINKETPFKPEEGAIEI